MGNPIFRLVCPLGLSDDAGFTVSCHHDSGVLEFELSTESSGTVRAIGEAIRGEVAHQCLQTSAQCGVVAESRLDGVGTPNPYSLHRAMPVTAEARDHVLRSQRIAEAPGHPGHDLGRPGLVEGQLAGLHARHRGRVDVEQRHSEAAIGEGQPQRKPDPPAAPDDDDVSAEVLDAAR